MTTGTAPVGGVAHVAHVVDVADEVHAVVRAVRHDAVPQLAAGILRARRTFVAGAGRSGLMARALSMRLMHLGLEAYTVGETATPALGAGDTLVVASGSARTRSLVPIVERATELGAFVLTVTAAPDAPLARLAELVVTIPTAHVTGEAPSIQPLGSLYEQCLLILFDTAALELMRRTGTSAEAMGARHANLE